jgi:xylan 1,4-beta-xylosidase
MKFLATRTALILSLFMAVSPLESQQPAAPGSHAITIDAKAPGRAFPHFWEQMFGSGRAILSLRDSYRRDLRAVRSVTDFRYVRFHAILDDEVGVFTKDHSGRPVYNFSYVDQIYDGLLADGVRPFVELSFMPSALAASQTPHVFWYKPLPNPPVSYPQWGDLVEHFVQHLVDRYGIDETAQWYFEVWNEPNIDFWTGKPAQSTYFELYDAAARAVKKVDARLRVGGPATAQAAWVDAMIAHAAATKVPLDFVSTHVYGNDSARDVFGTDETIPRSDMVARAVRKVYDQVKHSTMPDLPIIWSEYNASYKNEVDVTDSAFMGPWLANNVRMCDGLQTIMSYWSFSDVFEEQGVVKTPFYGGYGLVAELGIPKPAYNAFALLHRLGTERLPEDAGWALVTRRADGSLVIASWNYAPPETPGAAIDVNIALQNAGGLHQVRTTIVDRSHGSPLPSWEAMGRPATPTEAQIEQLRKAAALATPAFEPLQGSTLHLHLEPYALAVTEVTP